jgi:hypothetical protein
VALTAESIDPALGKDAVEGTNEGALRAFAVKPFANPLPPRGASEAMTNDESTRVLLVWARSLDLRTLDPVRAVLLSKPGEFNPSPRKSPSSDCAVHGNGCGMGS